MKYSQEFEFYTRNVNPELKAYIEEKIFPEYSKNEEGHGIGHIKTVIERSRKLSSAFDVNQNMVFTVAAFHDIGHHIDRKNHEKVSAEIFYNDENMKKLQDKIKNLKVVREACLKIVESLIHIADQIGTLLYDYIAYYFDENNNVENIRAAEIKEIIEYIENTFDPPIIPTEAIQEYIDQNDKLRGTKKLTKSKYNIEGSKGYIPYLDGNKSSMKYKDNQWIRSTNNEYLKEEDLE